MHFVRTFSIMPAYGIRLIAIAKVQNYGKIVGYASKAFLKMGGGKILPPGSTPGH